MWLGVIDLDGFKTVNDTLGHHAGDQLLLAVAKRLSSVIPPHDMLARLGGDEFAILLTPTSGGTPLANQATDLAEEILKALQDPILVSARSIDVTASIGVAVAHGGISTDQLVTWADAAMHEAKRAGGDRIRRYEVALG